jgi:hypothetical protein
MALMQLATPSLTRSTNPRRTSKRTPAALEKARSRNRPPSFDGNDRANEGMQKMARCERGLGSLAVADPAVLVTGLHKTLYRGVAQLALRARAPRKTKVIHE